MPHSSSCQPPVKKQLLTFLVVFLALGAVTLSVHGHGEAKGIVIERHTLMNAIKKANKTISGMVRGKTELDRPAFAASAQNIANNASRSLSMFPDTEASRHGKGSNAKQIIWSEFDKFSKWNDDMQAYAEKLADMAMTASLDDLKAQHRLLGKTCGGCHKAYRTKKKH